MDLKQKRSLEALGKSGLHPNNHSRNLSSQQPLTHFDSQNLPFASGSSQTFPEFTMPAGPSSFHPIQRHDMKSGGHLDSSTLGSTLPDWNPKTMLNNLTFLEQKIHQVQDIVRSIIGQEGQHSTQPNELAAQQQLVTADLTCIIIQLISTAGSLLPSIKSTLLSSNPSAGKLESIINSPIGLGLNSNLQQNDTFPSEKMKPSNYEEQTDMPNKCGVEVLETVTVEDHDVKDYEDGGDCENLPPGSYEVLQLEKDEILAPHTHFCAICGKGFKRDANLRMHMRGHGDEYKTPAALAKPSKESNSESVLIKRYSCPFIGCKRNKEHKKFQPLKTILCVKNHYKRSHCDKSYTCSRCNSKKFSVIADLKTHEKHCGRDKWLCSCGTTFSRKDKLFGHVALFQGHTPALPIDESKGTGTSDQMQSDGLITGAGSFGLSFTSSDDIDILDMKGIDDDQSYFSSLNFNTCNFNGFPEFPRAPFEDSDNSLPFLPAMLNDCVKKNKASSSSDLLG